ncbi:unnamed protein product [Timema podura]|uniref:Uncharacterized protein n=1 Tax=Timema podura TaxID=61482 RepID=A0ABN7NXT2_TIMPD|nr:unnamed protein product [Timema podura]
MEFDFIHVMRLVSQCALQPQVMALALLNACTQRRKSDCSWGRVTRDITERIFLRVLARY